MSERIHTRTAGSDFHTCSGGHRGHTHLLDIDGFACLRGAQQVRGLAAHALAIAVCEEKFGLAITSNPLSSVCAAIVGLVEDEKLRRARAVQAGVQRLRVLGVRQEVGGNLVGHAESALNLRRNPLRARGESHGSAVATRDSLCVFLLAGYCLPSNSNPEGGVSRGLGLGHALMRATAIPCRCLQACVRSQERSGAGMRVKHSPVRGSAAQQSNGPAAAMQHPQARPAENRRYSRSGLPIGSLGQVLPWKSGAVQWFGARAQRNALR